MGAAAKEAVEPECDEKAMTAALIGSLAEIKKIDDEMLELKDHLESLREHREEFEEWAIKDYTALGLTEPFKHENYTVRTAKGRESVTVDDDKAGALVGLIDPAVQKLILEQRWHFSDKKHFLYLWREEKLGFNSEVITWESVNEQSYLENREVVTVKPAVDRVIVERKKET